MSDQNASSPKSTGRSEEEGSPLHGEALAQAIRRQVEYYFSKENLQQDAYLTSHMDANMSVPIAVIMKFSKMRALTQDESVIIKALENSSVSVVDGRIKANVKSGGRSTIILRDIPSDASEDEVREIFAYEGCKHISSIKSEIGDTWFIGMDSEEDAKDTLIDLKLKKRTFRGQPVKGRMKTETIVRSFYPVQTAPVAFGGVPFGFPQMPFGYGMVPNGMPMPPPQQHMEAVGAPAVVMPPAPPAHAAAAAETTTPSTDNSNKDSARASGDKKPAATAAPVSSSTQTKSAAPATAAASSNTAANNRENTNTANTNSRDRRSGATPANGVKPAGGAATDSKDKKAAGGAGAGRGGNANATPNKKEGGKAANGPAVEISPANFPPLMGQGQDETPIPTPGYKTPFHKYNFDDVINIVKSVQDTTLPETIRPSEHPISMSTTPNLDLLQRQRTFSIDETREQLRQGKPVQQLAVASSSANDYNSLMHGYDSDAGQGGSNITKTKITSSTNTAAVAAKKAGTGSWAAMVATPAAQQPALPTTGSSSSAAGGASASSSSGTNNSNNWKRGDKVAAAGAEKSATGAASKSPEKKPAGTAASSAAPAADKDSKDKKKGDKAKKDGKPRDEKEGGAKGDEATEKVEVPSSWGGKPTFANMLKTVQQTDASAEGGAASPTSTPASGAASSSSGAAPAHSSPKKSGDNGGDSARKERGAGGGGNKPRGDGNKGGDHHRGEHRGEHRGDRDRKERGGERREGGDKGHSNSSNNKSGTKEGSQ